GAGELHHPRGLNLSEPDQQLLAVLQQRTLEEAQRAILLEALNDDDVVSVDRVTGLSPLALLRQVKSRQELLQRRDLSLPPFSICHLHAAPSLSQAAPGSPPALLMMRHREARNATCPAGCLEPSSGDAFDHSARCQSVGRGQRRLGQCSRNPDLTDRRRPVIAQAVLSRAR